MACRTTYSWSHNFPRLATESGFAFSSHRPRVLIDWNRIKLIDIDDLIKGRNFVTVEEHINDILDCILESEFDLKILDDGVVKLFRLAQLAIEYQQFCKQYLDRSVVVLKDELTITMQEIDKMRKEIRNKDDEIRKLRKKYKNPSRPPLPYGNENIATMILRTLSNRGDIYSGTSIGEAVPQYNKCQYCDKVFLNQLYLQSHITRRHTQMNGHITELLNQDNKYPNDLPERIPSKTNSASNEHNLEVEQLKNEIRTLKDKVQETELLLNSKAENVNIEENNNANVNNQNSKTSENIFMDKFEEWKQKEHDKYKKEISELRHQLLENIHAFKESALSTVAAARDDTIVDQLKNTIKEQEYQINTLKYDMANLPTPANKETLISTELQKQEDTWRSRMETLEKQHEDKLNQVLKTLETVYREVKTAREIGETERARVVDLQAALLEKENMIITLQEQALQERREFVPGFIPSYTTSKKEGNKLKNVVEKDEGGTSNQADNQNSYKINNVTSRQTLYDLHLKAQELLSRNINTDSDTSDSQNIPEKTIKERKTYKKNKLNHEDNNLMDNGKPRSSSKKEKKKNKKIDSREETKTRNILGKTKTLYNQGRRTKLSIKKSNNKLVNKLDCEQNTDNESYVTSSPTKVIRAKLTEEVNSRLMSMGVDPLRSGIPAATFNKQRSLLQHNQDIKAKKDGSYSKTRNRILTYLDSKISKDTDKPADISSQVSPNKEVRNFKVSSIFSNVKHKAMSLMKSSERISKIERNVLNDDIAKKAALLLKTPPGSIPTSPATQRRSSLDSRGLLQDRVKRALSRITYKESPIKIQPPKSQSVEVLFNRNNKSTQSITDSDNVSSNIDSSSSGLEEVEVKNKKDSVKVVTSVIAHEPSKSIEKLLKSPIRKPMNSDSKNTDYTILGGSSKKGHHANSPTKLLSGTLEAAHTINMYDGGTDSEADMSIDANIVTNSSRKFLSEENLLTRSIPASPKGVLKNAPSISSLSKKKVLFDLEANQMKSVSASPSQSVTEGNDVSPKQHKVIDLSNDWEISSIDDVPTKEAKSEEPVKTESRRSPKIAELTQRIESQLARRPDVKKPVGAIEVMSQGPGLRGTVNVLMSGSNTSLGSSLLDDSNEIDTKKLSPSRSKTPVPVPAPRFVTKSGINKDASDLDVSDWSIDDILKGK